MPTHTASIIVQAPVDKVYALWTRFPEYPNLLSHVRSVSYIDRERTRWIVNIVGRHEWAARNENWIPDRQIGWRSIDGLGNRGLVVFAPSPDGSTVVDVTIEYSPPAEMLGAIGEILGAGKAFEQQLRGDLERFACLFANGATPRARSSAAAPEAPARLESTVVGPADTASPAASVRDSLPDRSAARQAEVDTSGFPLEL
jgi:uncharacterized membrane protein